MAMALLGKCFALTALVLLFYTCCYAFRIREVGVATQQAASSVETQQQRTTCLASSSKFGRCIEKTTTVAPRKWHEATSLRGSPLTRRPPPVEATSPAREGDATSTESGSRLPRFGDKVSNTKIVKVYRDFEEEEEEEDDEDDGDEVLVEEEDSDDDDDDDVMVEDDEEEEIQAEEDGESEELSPVESEEYATKRSKEKVQSWSKKFDDEDDVEEKGIENDDEEEDESEDKSAKSNDDDDDDDDDDDGIEDEDSTSSTNIFEWVWKGRAVDSSKAKSDVKDKEKKIPKDDSSRKQEEKPRKASEETDRPKEDDEKKEARKDADKSVSSSSIKKAKYADKDKAKSVEQPPIAKSTEKPKVEAKKSTEKTKTPKQEAEDTPKERSKVAIEKAKEVKSEVKVQEKTKKRESPKTVSSESPKSKAPAPKAEEKQKLPSKSKDQLKQTEKSKPKKGETSAAAGVDPKSKAKRQVDVTRTLAELNDEILRVPSFVPNFTAVEDINCQQHGKIFLRQLRGYKLWALQMLDSSAKIPSGLLRGNVNQLGDFDECLGIMAQVKMNNRTIRIQGKYCLATVDLHAAHPDMKLPVNLLQARTFIKGSMRDPGHFIPRFTTANWALCLPAACSAKDAEITLQHSLSHYNLSTGIRFTVEVDPQMCYVKQKSHSYSKETIAVLYFYATIVCLVLVATARDYLVVSEGKGSYSERIIMSFSLRRTTKALLKENSLNSGDIVCIHGIRSLSMIAVYVAHQLIIVSRMPFANRVALTEVANNAASTVLRSSALYTDSFLLLSGVLTAYNMTKDLKTRGEIRWFCRFVARYIRLTPALLVVIFWYAFVMEHVGSGPQWSSVIVQNADLCKRNAWTNLLYIQNFFPFEEMCATHTHQLAVDMQLSLLAPVLVFFLQVKPIIGVILLFFIVQVSATLRYMAVANNYLSIVIFHGMSIKHLYKTANLTYALPLHRATPYVFGVALGVLLRHTGKEVKIHKVFVILGWLIALTFGSWSLFSPWRLAKRDYVYDAEEATYYAVISPVSWALALCWTIFACFTDHGGVANKLLSNYWLLLFSRISYVVYLTQFAVFFYNVGSTRYSMEFQVHRAIDPLEAITVLLASIVVTLFFDIPMQEVKNVIMESTDTLSTEIPREKEKSENKAEANETLKKIGNGAKVLEEEDELTLTGWDWQKDIVHGGVRSRNENIDEEEPIDVPNLKRSEGRRKSFLAVDTSETEELSNWSWKKEAPATRKTKGWSRDDEEDYMEQRRINRGNDKMRYPNNSVNDEEQEEVEEEEEEEEEDEETLEYLRMHREEEELRRSRRSLSRPVDSKRFSSPETEDEYLRRRRKDDGYLKQYRRSGSRERRVPKECDDHRRTWELATKEKRSSSMGPDTRRFLVEPERNVRRRSVPRSMETKKRPFSTESEEAEEEEEEEGGGGGRSLERRAPRRNGRRHPTVEPKVSDEEDWEEELRIRRRQFVEKHAMQQSSGSGRSIGEERDEEDYSLKRRSSAEGRIALLKDPSGTENMDAWTKSVGPRLAQMGSSQEPSEPEDDTAALQRRREYRERAPPLRDASFYPNEKEEEEESVASSSSRRDDDVTHFNFVLTKDSKRTSLQDLSRISQDESDLTDSWSVVKENENAEILPKSSLGLFKRESIIKSQASEEDPEYYVPERPKLVQQEEEHPFKKAWQMQKSRSEEDYVVKDFNAQTQNENKKSDESPAVNRQSGGKQSSDEATTENVGTPEVIHSTAVYREGSTDTEENRSSSKSATEENDSSTSTTRRPSTEPDDNGPCCVSQTDDDSSSTFVWPSEEEQLENYNKCKLRRRSATTIWDWEEEET